MLASLFEIFEKIEIPKGQIPKEKYKNTAIQLSGGGSDAAQLISWWARSDRSKPEDFNVRLIIVDPSQQIIGEKIFSVKMTDVKSRSVVRFPALLYKGPGEYFYIVQTKSDADEWQAVASLPLEMVEVPQMQN